MISDEKPYTIITGPSKLHQCLFSHAGKKGDDSDKNDEGDENNDDDG